MRKETEESKRQKALARTIGVEFCNTPNLKPLMRQGQFYRPPLPATDTWLAQLAMDNLSSIAFAAVAAKLETISGHWHIIDHAWLAGYDDTAAEPWALVTEPYAEGSDVKSIELLAADAMPEWGIEIHVLPASRSSWNPGHCIPIIATIGIRGYANFFRKAIPWAIGFETHTDAPFT